MQRNNTPETILVEALELTSLGERASYLDEACGSDGALRDEVESLLAAYLAADEFMNTVAAPVWQETPGEKEGDSIGRYKLLQKIGEGGFGTVYLAEQTEPVKRRVALKVIKAGMDSKEVIARFEAERQALALMDHPHIAKVHDAGTTEGGRPYFVMELVKGMPLTKYCKDKDLDTIARLNLFMDVCAAVQHAHQKGIIHRDLKPSNILVSPHDGKPVVKVIDFGIAKAISMELTEKTVFTQLGRMIGTPQYMSPEQAELNALDVDTRSDIYSLGVVLYELLTGTTPLDGEQLRSAAYGEMQRLIREETPVKPSTRVSTFAKLRDSRFTPDSSALRGDLDWIVMKALEKERERRYETANGFSADIQRFLNQEPVSAGPPGIGYKMRKFVRRNRTAVAVGSTIALLLIAGIFGTSWFAVSSQEAQKKEQAAKEAALRSKEETQQALTETEAALKQSHYEEAKAWLERARLQKFRKNDFAAAMMAAKGLGFRGFGAERQTEEFRKANPVLLEKEKPEFGQLMGIAMSGNVSCRPIWRSPDGAHASNVQTVAFSPDGTTLASGSIDKAIELWDLSTGKGIRTFVGHQSTVMSVAFSPDGSALASGSYDNTIKLWDVSTGKEIRTLEGYHTHFTSVAFSPDGTNVASGSYDKTIKLWDVSTGKEIRTFEGHQTTVSSVAFSPDGTTLASGSYDNTIKLWDVSTGKEIHTFEGHQSGVISVAFSPDGATLASGSADKTIKLWDVFTGNEIRTFEGHRSKVTSISFSPDGTTLASGCDDKTIKLWDVFTGKETRTFEGHQFAVTSVAFSPDGTTLASGSADRTIKLWAVSTVREIRSYKGHQYGVRSVAFSPDGTTLASASGYGMIKLLDVSTGKEIRTFERHQSGVTSVAFSPDGTTLASGSFDDTIKLWDFSTGKEIRTFVGHEIGVTSIAFNPTGTILASGSYDNTIKLWDVSTGTEIHTFEGHQRGVASVAFSPDGTTLAGGGWDNTIKLWDVFTGKELRSLGGHQSKVTSMAFSPDGTTLASGSDDNTIKLWDVSTGKEIQTFEGHDFRVKSVAFSPDGTTLASGSEDKTIKLWDVSTGKEILTFEEQQSMVRSVAFSPDGTTLASGSDDKTIKLWCADNSPINLAGYLDPSNPWCRLEGSRISWNPQPGNRAGDKGSGFLNVSPFGQMGILRGARSQEEKNRALFWNYLHAENWNSARLMYGRLEDPATKENAREMTILKRAAKAQSAFDRGLYHHAGWHLREITSLLKPEETDPAMLKVKEAIATLKVKLDKLPR